MTAPGLAAYLAARDDRCDCGYHVATQGCHCGGSEWTTFTTALRKATRDDGTVHVNDVRPLIRGRIEPKHIGQLWRRARTERLIAHQGWEQSTDHLGANADKQSRVYRALATTTRSAA